MLYTFDTFPKEVFAWLGILEKESAAMIDCLIIFLIVYFLSS